MPEETDTNMDFAATLAEFLYETHYENLPKSVCESAKQIALDTLSAIIAGSSSLGIDVLRSIVEGWEGTRQSSILGFGDRVPAPQAVSG